MIHGVHGLLPVGLCLAIADVAIADVAIAQSLQELCQTAEKKGFRTGVVVRDLRSGRDTFRHRSDESFIPASNQKLLTAAAALWGLGADYRFETVFRLREGFLDVVAGGDPNWLHRSDNDPAVIFAKVAADLRLAGVARIRGIRVVAGPFTGPTRPDGWPRDQYGKTYAAPTGGVVLEAGCFLARISAAKGKARVRLLAPPADVPFGGRIRMSSKKKRTFAYWLSHHGAKFTAHGEFSTRARPVEVRGVCQDPQWLFVLALRSVLRGAGIRIASGVRDSQRGFALDVPGDRELRTWRSSLREAFVPMLQDSSNFHAEQVFRTLGAKRVGDGSFAGGSSAMRQLLTLEVGVPVAAEIVDGSGLSRGNRVTPAYLASVLVAVLRGPHARVFAEDLPQGGVDGTLRRRFRGEGQAVVGRATWAKTGTINGVKALSGFVQLPNDKLRIFSILMNRRRGTSTRGAASLQDSMVEAIYRGRYASR